MCLPSAWIRWLSGSLRSCLLWGHTHPSGNHRAHSCFRSCPQAPARGLGLFRRQDAEGRQQEKARYPSAPHWPAPKAHRNAQDASTGRKHALGSFQALELHLPASNKQDGKTGWSLLPGAKQGRLDWHSEGVSIWTKKAVHQNRFFDLPHQPPRRQ